MMNENRLSKEVRKIFRNQGWKPTRKVKFKYPKEEFDLPFFVKELLSNLYKLSIDTTATDIQEKGDVVSYYSGCMDFSPEYSIGENKEDGLFYYYSKLLNQNFYPLGEMTRDLFYIGIDDAQVLYLIGDRIFKMCNNFYESIESIATNLKGLELNEDTLKWEEY